MNSTTVVAGLALGTFFLVGCLPSSGGAGAWAVSENNSVIAFAGDWGEIMVCDGKTITKVATRGGVYRGTWFWLTRDGQFVLVFKQPLDKPEHVQPGGQLLVYRVSSGQRWSVQLRASDWGTPDKLGPAYPMRDMVVSVADGPVVTFTTGDLHVQWRPGGKFQKTLAPVGSSVVHPAPYDGGPDGQFPLVELGPEGWTPRRTVWVRRGGKVVELAREDTLWKHVFLVATFPIMFWSQYWWEAASGINESDTPSELEEKKARLRKLVALETARHQESGKRTSTTPEETH